LLVEFSRCADGVPNVFIEDLPKYTGKDIPGSLMAVLHRNFGVCIGASLVAMDKEPTLVRPQEWQKVIGAGTTGLRSKGQWKAHLSSIAKKSFPEAKITLKTADAALIWIASFSL
jgi:hypothetical protein